MTPGQFGIDVASHQVWVVSNHNSQFAVVPEPGSLALAGLALATLAAWNRRRRVS